MALEEECIERLGDLEGEQYRDAIRFYPGERVAPALLLDALLDCSVG